AYVNTKECRARHLRLYFGEIDPPPCGRCDVCRGGVIDEEEQKVDEAQKVAQSVSQHAREMAEWDAVWKGESAWGAPPPPPTVPLGEFAAVWGVGELRSSGLQARVHPPERALQGHRRRGRGRGQGHGRAQGGSGGGGDGRRRGRGGRRRHQ